MYMCADTNKDEVLQQDEWPHFTGFVLDSLNSCEHLANTYKAVETLFKGFEVAYAKEGHHQRW